MSASSRPGNGAAEWSRRFVAAVACLLLCATLTSCAAFAYLGAERRRRAEYAEYEKWEKKSGRTPKEFNEWLDEEKERESEQFTRGLLGVDEVIKENQRSLASNIKPKPETPEIKVDHKPDQKPKASKQQPKHRAHHKPHTN